MSWVRIYVHLVFSTKGRIEFLYTPEVRKKVFKHIKQNAKEKGIWLDSINGWSDHVHCLISLGKEQTISNVVQQIKGESSYWINQNDLLEIKFLWQNDYWAVGVSESHITSVRNYIQKQEFHHVHHSFNDEITRFMDKYGWSYVKE